MSAGLSSVGAHGTRSTSQTCASMFHGEQFHVEHLRLSAEC